MKEQFCSYEISLKLKELGFNEDCFGWYTSYASARLANNNKPFLGNYNPNTDYKFGCFAPLYQQIIDWFREKHGIWIFVDLTYDFSSYSPRIYKKGKTFSFHDNEYSSYYEAREQAILKCIELLKNK